MEGPPQNIKAKAYLNQIDLLNFGDTMEYARKPAFF